MGGMWYELEGKVLPRDWRLLKDTLERALRIDREAVVQPVKLNHG